MHQNIAEDLEKLKNRVKSLKEVFEIAIICQVALSVTLLFIYLYHLNL